MAMLYNKIDEGILEDLHDAGFTPKQIEEMSVEDAFTHYLEWNGIIGWGPTLIKALDILRAAENK